MEIIRIFDKTLYSVYIDGTTKSELNNFFKWILDPMAVHKYLSENKKYLQNDFFTKKGLNKNNLRGAITRSGQLMKIQINDIAKEVSKGGDRTFDEHFIPLDDRQDHFTN